MARVCLSHKILDKHHWDRIYTRRVKFVRLNFTSRRKEKKQTKKEILIIDNRGR